MAKGTQLSGNNITGVSGAQHGAKQNAASMQRAAGKAGQANYEFGSMGTGQQSGAQLSGNNITGVSGAQHAAKRNNASMQRAAQKADQ
ncbi:hypothetical protein [Symbiobacterium thermophilum]|jgi:hypothetical protein|nr:hypothetical protein [Symbiobacterium thermophilum]MBY6275419.1 hypothetical protein [Symbiobacterium thermophilum]